MNDFAPEALSGLCWKTYDREFNHIFNETRQILREKFRVDFGEDYQNHRYIELKHPRLLEELKQIEWPARFGGRRRSLDALGVDRMEFIEIIALLDCGKGKAMIEPILRRGIEFRRQDRAKNDADFYNPNNEAYEWMISEIFGRWDAYRTTLSTPDTALKTSRSLLHKSERLSKIREPLAKSFFDTSCPQIESAMHLVPNLKECEYVDLAAQDLTLIHRAILEAVLDRIESSISETQSIDTFKQIYYNVMNDWLGDEYVIERENLDSVAELIWPKLQDALLKRSSMDDVDEELRNTLCSDP